MWNVSEYERCAYIYCNGAKAWLIGAPKQKHPEDSADEFTQPANPASVNESKQKVRLVLNS